MDTSAVMISMLAEMKKMSETNAMLLTVLQQQTELIKEQKAMIYQLNLNQSESLRLAQHAAWARLEASAARAYD
jgi:hypothetical protein